MRINTKSASDLGMVAVVLNYVCEVGFEEALHLIDEEFGIGELEGLESLQRVLKERSGV